MAAEGVSHCMVDSKEAMIALIDELQSLPAGKPLYIDLEGISLSRHGSISLVAIFVQPRNLVFLVDVHVLQSSTFTIAAANGTTFKSILETDAVIKVFFDLRNDSDALHHHFGIRLLGVEDVQLMENAARPAGRRRFVNGLERCIENHAPLSVSQKRDWKIAKENGLKLFHPAKGGSYDVFNVRPLSPDLIRYCVNDVQYLPDLRDLYWGHLDEPWRGKVTAETKRRVAESQSAVYEPQSEAKKYGPWERGGLGMW